MEAIFVLVAAVASSILVIVLLLLIAGISAVFGASFSTVFSGGLWALLIPPALILYGWLWGRNSVVVKRVDIPSQSIPASFDGYRIVQISDLHLRSFRDRPGHLSETIDRINAEKPDIIVFTGDLVTVHPDEIPPFAEELAELSAPDGVFSVMGNHDYCPYNKWESSSEREKAIANVRRMETRFGWHLLDNTHIDIRRRHNPSDTASAAVPEDIVSIAGVENVSASPHFESRGNLEDALEGVEGNFTILLSHDPTHWRSEVLGKRKVDLMLSGHTHNAQIRFFGLEPSRLVFRENSGMFSCHTVFGEQRLYVNDGLGTTLFPARIGVPSEITVLTLRKR